jgi:hypothetical protein
MSVPQNAAEIFAGLLAGGLTPIAAAGVLGNIEAESGGSLNSVGSGGCGLLGYTPCSSAPPGGAVQASGVNPSVAVQASAAVTYVSNSYPGGILALNAFTDPGAAGASFAKLGERCAECGGPGSTGSSQLAPRSQNAADVYAAYKAGTLGQPSQGTAASSSSSSSSFDPFGLGGIVAALTAPAQFFSALTKGVTYLRIGEVLVGAVVMAVGAWMFLKILAPGITNAVGSVAHDVGSKAKEVGEVAAVAAAA